MDITNTFKCNELSAEKIRYETCLIRQQAMMLAGAKSRHPKYPVCHYCDKGKKIKAMFTDWKYEKHSKRRKPDRVLLHKDKRVRNYEPARSSNPQTLNKKSGKRDNGNFTQKGKRPRWNSPDCKSLQCENSAIREAIIPDTAERFDKLFEGLKVEEKFIVGKWCKNCNGVGLITLAPTTAQTGCPMCKGSGKILRELTEDEKEEVWEAMQEIVFGSDGSGAIKFVSGKKVVRR